VSCRTAVFSVWLLLGFGTIAGAEESEVAPDRPDVTDSTQTVPFGAVQLETGIEYARARQAGGPIQQNLTFHGTLRVGLGDRFEARLEAGPVVELQGGEDTDHGTLALGLKYRFVDDSSWWPSLGVEPFVRIPFSPTGSGRPDFGARGLASWTLPWRLSLDVNAGMGAVAQTGPSGYLLQALVSASLGTQITERLSAFVELFFATRGERGGRDSLGFDTGLVYLLTRRVALDASVATSLTGRGPDVAIQTGVSVRFGR